MSPTKPTQPTPPTPPTPLTSEQRELLEAVHHHLHVSSQLGVTQADQGHLRHRLREMLDRQSPPPQDPAQDPDPCTPQSDLEQALRLLMPNCSSARISRSAEALLRLLKNPLGRVEIAMTQAPTFGSLDDGQRRAVAAMASLGDLEAPLAEPRPPQPPQRRTARPELEQGLSSALMKFTDAMADKLYQVQESGARPAGAWADPARVNSIRKHLLLAVYKGDPLDVANLAMFLWNMGEPTMLEQTAVNRENNMQEMYELAMNMSLATFTSSLIPEARIERACDLMRWAALQVPTRKERTGC